MSSDDDPSRAKKARHALTAPPGSGQLPSRPGSGRLVAPPGIAASARLAALRFTVRDRDALLAVLAAGAIPAISHMGNVVVGPDRAIGATLVFEAAGGAGQITAG